MRSIWKGTISFGLVSVPVKLYGATEDRAVKSHQVHAGCGGRMRQKRVCEECSNPVEWGDIAKGFMYSDETIILSDDDLATLPSEQSRAIEVLEFVPAGSLDSMLWDTPYFLGPDGSDKAYTLLAATLGRVDRIALVQFAMRGKTRLAALTALPKEGVLVMHTLRWPDEIRHASEIKVKEVEIKPVELDLAAQLVQSMANEFNPDRYRDTYQVELQELIAAKATGQPLPSVAAEQQEADDVSDLLAKLEASIKGKGKK